ncbi:MAG TPA: class I SAM-dependent methyltransferase [Desulfobacterales bacterium]
MHPDRRKWNRKYRDGLGRSAPAAIVKSYCRYATAGLALDIAAGNGRNALYLARQGFTIEALDISEEGLRKFAGKHPRVRCACVDLEHYRPLPSRYNLVINIKYLNRRLMPYLSDALRSGGLLIFETFLKSTRPPRKPFCEDHLLHSNELLHVFPDMQILYYRERTSAAPGEPYPLASLVAVKK